MWHRRRKITSGLVDDWRARQAPLIERDWGKHVVWICETTVRDRAWMTAGDEPPERLWLSDHEIERVVESVVSSLRNSIFGPYALRDHTGKRWQDQMEQVRDALRHGRPLPLGELPKPPPQKEKTDDTRNAESISQGEGLSGDADREGLQTDDKHAGPGMDHGQQ